jgi:hypothetical protein
MRLVPRLHALDLLSAFQPTQEHVAALHKPKCSLLDPVSRPLDGYIMRSPKLMRAFPVLSDFEPKQSLAFKQTQQFENCVQAVEVAPLIF